MKDPRDAVDANTLTNYEVLSGNKTLSIGSPRNQFLKANGVGRDVVFDESCEVVGTTFYIKAIEFENSYLTIKDKAGTIIIAYAYGAFAKFTWNGIRWAMVEGPHLSQVDGPSIGDAGFSDVRLGAFGGAVYIGPGQAMSVRSTGVCINNNNSGANGQPVAGRFFSVMDGDKIGLKYNEVDDALSTDVTLRCSPKGFTSAFHVDEATGHIGFGIDADETYQLKISSDVAGSLVRYYGNQDNSLWSYVKGKVEAYSGILLSVGAYGTVSNHPVDFIANSGVVARLQTSGNVSVGTKIDQANLILNLCSASKAFAPPRMTTEQRDAVTWVAGDAGGKIYNLTLAKEQLWNGAAWETMISAVTP